MQIHELEQLCLGSENNSLSVERPIDPCTPNEILYSGRFGFLPEAIQTMKMMCFSVNGERRDLRADVVVYVE